MTFTIEVLDGVNLFSKVIGYQNLYIIANLLRTKLVKKNSPFIIHLTKEMKNLHKKDFNVLKNEREEDGKTFHSPGLILCILAMLTKVIYRLSAMYIKIPMTFIAELEKTIIKFV